MRRCLSRCPIRGTSAPAPGPLPSTPHKQRRRWPPPRPEAGGGRDPAAVLWSWNAANPAATPTAAPPVGPKTCRNGDTRDAPVITARAAPAGPSVRDTSERSAHDTMETETASTMTTSAAWGTTPQAETPPSQPSQGSNTAKAAMAHKSMDRIPDTAASTPSGR